jgi:hypothetical protein
LFLISQTFFPALLYLPGFQMVRLPCRVALYLMSLVALAYGWSGWASRRLPPHPACRPLLYFAIWIALSLANPGVNSHLAAIAQLLLYISVFAPIFWVPQQVLGERQLARLLWILLVCNGVNSVVGLLQVYDPARWQPAEYAAAVTNFEYGGLDAATYIGADGRRIVRPSGLFDTPGAVCGPASVAFLVGISLALAPRTSLLGRFVAAGFGFCGLTAIWFSHVRSLLLIAIGMVVVRVIYLALYRRVMEATVLGVATWLTFTATLTVAMGVGGEAVLNRFASLTEVTPDEMYYKRRGVQLEYGLTELPALFPLGAGPGRWGMMYVYFGDRSNTENPSFFAELAIPAWLLDGGVPALVLYLWALVLTVRHDFRLARVAQRRENVPLATIVIAVAAGTYPLMFSFTPFTNQVGIQFWFLVGALHGVYCRHREP